MYELNLYDITYDKSKWLIQENRDGYYLKNLKTHTTYVLKGKFIGICQVSENDFLIYRRIFYDTWQIVRYSILPDLSSKVTFKQDCHHLYVLSDKTILFDTHTVYDVEKNDDIEAFNWVNSFHSSCGVSSTLSVLGEPKNYTIKLCLPTMLYQNIYAFVDTKNFKIINNEVFSTLQNRVIKLGKKKPYFTIEDVVKEDLKDASKIFDLFFFSTEEQRKLVKDFEKSILSG